MGGIWSLTQRRSRVAGLALAWMVAVATMLGGCAPGPSQEDVARVRDALNAAGVSSVPVEVSSEVGSGGFARELYVHMVAPSTEFSSDDLLRVLRVIYHSTPDGFGSYIWLAVNAPASSGSAPGAGGFIRLGPLLAELGLGQADAFSSDYYFKRSDLDGLFD